MLSTQRRATGFRSRVGSWRRSRLIQVGLAVGSGYLALAITFSVLTPAWENNDEADHVHYVEYVMAQGGPPRIAFANGIESHQPPLYYYLEAGWQHLLDIRPFTPSLKLASSGSGTQPVESLSHNYTSAQHAQAVWLHLLRIPSIACGLATVLAAVATGWLVTRREAFAAAVGATVACWPKLLVVTSAVTNSALVYALCASALPCFLMWQRSRRWTWAAATGVLMGAAALTDETALPVAGLMLLLMVAYARPSRDWSAPLIAVLCFAAVCGWWFIRDAVLYGGPLASGAARAYLNNVHGLVRNPPTLSVTVLGVSLPKLVHSTWYDGGWNQLHLPHTLDLIVWSVAAISLAAAFWHPIRGWQLLATCATASIITWLLIIRATTQAEGRYVLVAIVAWAALLVGGSERLTPGSPVGLCVWPTTLVALDGYVLVTWLIPYAHL